MTSKQQIVDLLNRSNLAIARALVALNDRQTHDEQNSEQTKHDNGRGFTPADARMGTSMAGFYQRTGMLTAKQLAYWRKPNAKGVPRINKYAGQLALVAAEKAQQQAAVVECAASPLKHAVSVGDVGNLCEEQIALQETMDAYQEGAMGEGAAQDLAMERIHDRMMQIREELEEINRCEYKMQRDLML